MLPQNCFISKLDCLFAINTSEIHTSIHKNDGKYSKCS